MISIFRSVPDGRLWQTNLKIETYPSAEKAVLRSTKPHEATLRKVIFVLFRVTSWIAFVDSQPKAFRVP